jgi:ribonuclease Z
MMVWNLTKKGIEERMAVSTDEAWDVPGTEKGLEPDKTRKPEIIWKELVDQRLDVSDANESWLKDYKKKYNLK